MATIAAIHDLSGVGRCSLVAAISIISATGHTCYPLPTAILSQQTCLPAFSYLDLTPYLPGYLAGWEAIGVSPDFIFTGFLGSRTQPEVIAAYVRAHPESTVLVDPVMGDQGEIYTCYDRCFVESMKQLVRQAHILTPNPTEFVLLAGMPVDAPLPREDAVLLEYTRRIDAPRLEVVALTGRVLEHGVENLVIDRRRNTVLHLPCKHTGVAYGGSGDLFSSILCGCLAGGLEVEQGAGIAGRFLTHVALETASSREDPRLGMQYEPYLPYLNELIREVHHAEDITRKN